MKKHSALWWKIYWSKCLAGVALYLFAVLPAASFAFKLRGSDLVLPVAVGALAACITCLALLYAWLVEILEGEVVLARTQTPTKHQPVKMVQEVFYTTLTFFARDSMRWRVVVVWALAMALLLSYTYKH